MIAYTPLFFLRNGAQKFLGILIVIEEAFAYVLSGMYGSVSQLCAGNAILTILQSVLSVSLSFA